MQSFFMSSHVSPQINYFYTLFQNFRVRHANLSNKKKRDGSDFENTSGTTGPFPSTLGSGTSTARAVTRATRTTISTTEPLISSSGPHISFAEKVDTSTAPRVAIGMKNESPNLFLARELHHGPSQDTSLDITRRTAEVPARDTLRSHTTQSIPVCASFQKKAPSAPGNVTPPRVSTN